MYAERRINEHRSTVVFTILIVLSLVSLATGAQGNLITRSVRWTVSVVSNPFLYAFERADAGVSYVTGWFVDYGTLRETVAGQNVQMAQWQNRLAGMTEVTAENERLRELLEFERDRPEFTLRPATVLQHSRGILTIDLGARQGIRPSMRVITAEGAIGQVTQVWPYTSNVITLQNVDCRMDVMVERTRVRGRIHGAGSDLSAICTMHYIDLNDEIREGDRIVTSPDSVFPSGLPVGRVVSRPQVGQLAQSVDVAPAANIFDIDEVFVLIRADAQAEVLALDREISDPAAETAILDIETLQERYAP